METEKLSNPKLNSEVSICVIDRNAAAAGRIKFDRIIIIVEINPYDHLQQAGKCIRQLYNRNGIIYFAATVNAVIAREKNILVLSLNFKESKGVAFPVIPETA